MITSCKHITNILPHLQRPLNDNDNDDMDITPQEIIRDRGRGGGSQASVSVEMKGVSSSRIPIENPFIGIVVVQP